MPTYDYECPEGHRFEVFQKMSDDPVAECPECGAVAKRLISGGAGFLFKGEGFYITDYRSEDYKKKASAEPGASAGAASPTEGGESASGVEGSGSGSARSGGPSGRSDGSSRGSDGSSGGSDGRTSSGSGGGSSGSEGGGAAGSGGSSPSGGGSSASGS